MYLEGRRSIHLSYGRVVRLCNPITEFVSFGLLPLAGIPSLWPELCPPDDQRSRSMLPDFAMSPRLGAIPVSTGFKLISVLHGGRRSA